MKALKALLTIAITTLSFSVTAEEYPNTAEKLGLFYQISIEEQSCTSKSVCDWFQTVESKYGETYLGIYDKFNHASKVANRLEEVGYNNVLTSPFFNGRKITLEQAAILSQSLLAVDGPRTWGGKELTQKEIDYILFTNSEGIELEYRLLTAPTATDYDMSFLPEGITATAKYNAHGFKYYEMTGFTSKTTVKAFRKQIQSYVPNAYIAPFFKDKQVSYSLAEIFENI